MADFKTYPPRQRNVIIQLFYKDLAHIMVQSADDLEVISFIETPQLEHIVFQLSTELQARSKENEPQ